MIKNLNKTLNKNLTMTQKTQNLPHPIAIYVRNRTLSGKNVSTTNINKYIPENRFITY